MPAFALVLLALVGAQEHRIPSPTHEVIFDREHLGRAGMDAFMSPDAVTYQRVYPVPDAGKAETTIGRWRLNAAGPEHELPEDTVAMVRSALQGPLERSLNLCLLHPDHVLRFKKGKDVIAVVTCYTCRLLGVWNGEKVVGDPAMPGGQPFSDLPGIVTAEEDCRAAWDESCGAGTYDLIAKAGSATYQRVYDAAPNGLKPDLQTLSKPKRMSEAAFAEVHSLLLIAPILKTKAFNPFEFHSPAVPSDILVTFDGGAGQFLFHKRAFDRHCRLSGGVTTYLPAGVQLWEALRGSLEQMSRE